MPYVSLKSHGLSINNVSPNFLLPTLASVATHHAPLPSASLCFPSASPLSYLNTFAPFLFTPALPTNFILPCAAASPLSLFSLFLHYLWLSPCFKDLRRTRVDP